MAPARSTRRGAHASSSVPQQQPGPDFQTENQSVKKIFIDPSFGLPLLIFVEKDVEDKESICQLIEKHGGTVTTGYSRVQFILVNPHKISGQNLYKQYAGKEGKIVLDVRWVHECIKTGSLLTYQNNWGGCKVTGTETIYTSRLERDTSNSVSRPMMSLPPLQPAMPPVDQMQAYQFQIYAPQIHAHPAPRHMSTAPPTWPIIGSSQPLQAASSPSQPHVIQRHPPPPNDHSQAQDQAYREGTWDDYSSPDDIATQHGPYEYPRYREVQNGWVTSGPYYDAAYEHSYDQQHYMEDQPDQSSGSNSVTGQAPISAVGQSAQATLSDSERPRGRKRTRTQPPPAVAATSLVVNRNPPARSPTPPTRVIKSTYGGNLFTADDVLYLKKYIDYCQDQCLVLSLREICERIAVKAPHHTFYSWRRYCNKHQIRLGGYTMNHDRPILPAEDETIDIEVDNDTPRASSSIQPVDHPPSVHVAGRLDMDAAKTAVDTVRNRDRSPTPPRCLYRSTTGKGVAFTQEDVNFLMKFMAYRKAQGTWDVVAFWKDVASKAPHHSKASWMKFWRRHKHELDREDGDEPLPPPPDKKLRYSTGDDILLAKYFVNKPDGTSDQVFQAFGRLHPHHPWKGWQEHHRIHRAKIDQLMQRLSNGEILDSGNAEET